MPQMRVPSVVGEIIYRVELPDMEQITLIYLENNDGDDYCKCVFKAGWKYIISIYLSAHQPINQPTNLPNYTYKYVILYPSCSLLITCNLQ